MRWDAHMIPQNCQRLNRIVSQFSYQIFVDFVKDSQQIPLIRLQNGIYRSPAGQEALRSFGNFPFVL